MYENNDIKARKGFENTDLSVNTRSRPSMFFAGIGMDNKELAELLEELASRTSHGLDNELCSGYGAWDGTGVLVRLAIAETAGT